MYKFSKNYYKMDRRNFVKSVFLFSALGFFTDRIFAVNKFLKFSDDYEIKKCKEKLKSLDISYSGKSIDEVISYVGQSFIGIPYEAGTLDVNTSREELIIKVTGLDCVTFVENTLVMSRLINKGDISFDSYKKELQLIRYRDGIINEYPSRLHYFTDWIYDNQNKGIVEDITKDIGGKEYNKTINFMTTHTDSYKPLVKNRGFIETMKDVEEKMNQRNLYYIPKGSVDNFYKYLNTGDIIATTTEIGGLDVTHTGLIYKDENGTFFLHASITKKQVIISDIELKGYLKGNKKQTGIIVARPQEVK
jgi:hypothetical protein